MARSPYALDRGELDRKHEAMAENAFSFFRATYYRWRSMAEKSAGGWPRAEGVGGGDLHVRTLEPGATPRAGWPGASTTSMRLSDVVGQRVVRLASSALLAIRSDHLAFDPPEACEAIEDGYAARSRRR